MEKQYEKKNSNPTNTQPSRRPFINSFNDLFAFWQTFFSSPRFFSEYDNYLSKHFRKICPFNIKAFNITVVNRINVSEYPIARDVLERGGKKRKKEYSIYLESGCPETCRACCAAPSGRGSRWRTWSTCSAPWSWPALATPACSSSPRGCNTWEDRRLEFPLDSSSLSASCEDVTRRHWSFHTRSLQPQWGKSCLWWASGRSCRTGTGCPAWCGTSPRRTRIFSSSCPRI